MVNGTPLESCGYSAAWRVINAKEWLPQSRERVYIVGFRTDLGIEMRWDGVVGSAEGLASCPADVLEPPESCDVQGCALSASQWKALQAQAEAYPRWPGCPDPLGERAVALRCAHSSRLLVRLTAATQHVTIALAFRLLTPRPYVIHNVPHCVPRVCRRAGQRPRR